MSRTSGGKFRNDGKQFQDHKGGSQDLGLFFSVWSPDRKEGSQNWRSDQKGGSQHRHPYRKGGSQILGVFIWTRIFEWKFWPGGPELSFKYPAPHNYVHYAINLHMNINVRFSKFTYAPYLCMRPPQTGWFILDPLGWFVLDPLAMFILSPPIALFYAS